MQHLEAEGGQHAAITVQQAPVVHHITVQLLGQPCQATSIVMRVAPPLLEGLHAHLLPAGMRRHVSQLPVHTERLDEMHQPCAINQYSKGPMTHFPELKPTRAAYMLLDTALQLSQKLVLAYEVFSLSHRLG